MLRVGVCTVLIVGRRVTPIRIDAELCRLIDSSGLDLRVLMKE